MKRYFLSSAALLALCAGVDTRAAEPTPGDSLRMYRMQEVEVTASRATQSTPVAFADLSRDEIARNSYGLDIPSLLTLTPSVRGHQRHHQSYQRGAL